MPPRRKSLRAFCALACRVRDLTFRVQGLPARGSKEHASHFDEICGGNALQWRHRNRAPRRSRLDLRPDGRCPHARAFKNVTLVRLRGRRPSGRRSRRDRRGARFRWRHERVAAADFVEMAGVLLGAARRQALHAKRQIAHRHANAQNARRDFRRGGIVEIHRESVMSAPPNCRNQDPGVID